MQSKSIIAQAENDIISLVVQNNDDTSILPTDDDTSFSLPTDDDTSFSLPTDGDISLILQNIDNTSLSHENDEDTKFDLQNRIPEDGRLNFTEIAIKYGHECDEHDVTTEDGHILKVFNVKGNKSRVIFLSHGFIDSSDTFIIRGEDSLALTLARNGWDVWAGNYRGNQYSRGHVTLDPDTDKRAFWNFSQHELGIYDLPAMIDHVLLQTGQTQLQAIGHSQGNTIFYILTSEKPEYNDKIKFFIALAPICYLHHVKGAVAAAVTAWPALSIKLQLLGVVQLFSRNSTLIKFIKVLCTRKIIGYPICSSVIFAGAGYDPEELGREFLPIVIGHYPDAASIKNGNHLVQVALKKRFCKYDYGWLKNKQVYGSVVPPNYLLKNVRMPVALILGRNDNLSALKDVELLRDQLPNVVYYHVMERKLFNHIDFVWGKDMNEYLFPMILDLLQEHHNDTLASP